VPDSHRIDDLRRRVQKDPASIAFAQLAEELRRSGALEESIETCRAGLALHPTYLSARVTLGRALLETNALDEACVELQTVLKGAPENLAAIRGLAEIFHRQGKLPEALAQYRAALALAKFDPDLQQTVEELSKTVEPQKPAHVSEGLSFDQMRTELFAVAPPPAVAPPDGAGSTSQGASTMPQGVTSTLERAPSALESAPSTLERAPSTLERAPSTLERAPSTVQSEAQVEPERALRTIVALEHWLDAIHVSRTQPRA
jgi:tetratricopeptide (TPR) repeat protein